MMSTEEKEARDLVRECLERNDISDQEKLKCAVLGLAEKIDENKNEFFRQLTDQSIHTNKLQIALADLMNMTAGLYNASKVHDKKIDKITDHLFNLEEEMVGRFNQNDNRFDKIDGKLENMDAKFEQMLHLIQELNKTNKNPD